MLWVSHCYFKVPISLSTWHVKTLNQGSLDVLYIVEVNTQKSKGVTEKIHFLWPMLEKHAF